MTRADPATTVTDPRETEVGSVFVSNYPPYSFWEADQVPRAREALLARPAPATPLGLYLHIPFCRKRCKFCYFKVYTEKTGSDVRRYADALAREVELVAESPAIAGRPLKFVYFGGGTPSFLAAKQLRALAERIQAALPWHGAEEVTFECEPGTLTLPKLEAIREIGVTRLSLGVESFDDRVLEENGRAHHSAEIRRVAPWIRAVGFAQVNIDLIAGMVGETGESWRENVRKTLAMEPDSVTVYQMELPFNTVYSRQILDGSRPLEVADWETKRAWHDHAFREFEAAGYRVSSAYTVVRPGPNGKFVYRDSVWRGCDLVGTGVASFSHVQGVHFQNEAEWGAYLGRVEAGEIPIARAYAVAEAERVTREMILQLKLGRVESEPFRRKFGVDILERFAPALDRLASRKLLDVDGGTIRLTRAGLLRVDSLLPEFYAEHHRGARYT